MYSGSARVWFLEHDGELGKEETKKKEKKEKKEEEKNGRTKETINATTFV